MGNVLTPTQLLIVWIIGKRLYRRIILILPTQYGKSLAVAIGVLLRITTHAEKWAIVAPTQDKARIIMDYIIEHIFDDPLMIELLDYHGTKEQLMQERSKTRVTFRGYGEIRIYTADATNSAKVKKALAGFGAPNIILDESGLLPDDVYAMVKRMVGGSEGTKAGTFLLEIGNPFYRNHFWRTWMGELYIKVFADYHVALAEGRYSEEYVEEMKPEAFFDQLYGCKFPEEDEDTPTGYFRLISDSFLENALIDDEPPIVEGDKGILGIDPNHGGSNYTVMVVRYPKSGFAKVVLKKRYADDKDITGEIIADAIRIMAELKITDYRTAPDAGGVGAGVSDGLERAGFLITPVLFGEKADDSGKFLNKKAELFMALRKWIRSENGKLVRNDGFLELKVINYKETATGKLQIEPKEKLAERKIQSPDTADALALTFINTDDIVEEDDVEFIGNEPDFEDDDDDII